jgi:Lipocalin-like domain
MNRHSTLALSIMALLFLGVVLPSGDAAAQQKTLKEQVVGTWTYVAVDTVGTDGSRVPMYGPNPQGVASFDSSGHYILLTARRGQSKFVSNNRMEGTPEEYKAVVQGSIAHFGTYTINEADTLTPAGKKARQAPLLMSGWGSKLPTNTVFTPRAINNSVQGTPLFRMVQGSSVTYTVAFERSTPPNCFRSASSACSLEGD